MLRRLFLLLFVAIPGLAFGQGAGIQGTITDQKGEAIIGASVIVTQGGIKKAITGTDVNGQYEAKPLEPGKYDITINSVGNPEQQITGVDVSSNSLTPVNFQYKPSNSGQVLGPVIRTAYKRPIIDKRGPLNAKIGDEIDKLADQSTAGVVALGPNVHAGGRGGELSIGGGRTTGNNIIVDGVQYTGGALGTTTLPPGTAGEIKTYASGVPAAYGDASGGVVVITSRGIASRFSGNVRLEKSVDGFGHNQGSFSISAPLLRRFTDSARTEKSPVLGFRLSGDVVYDKDNSPNYGGNYILKDDVRSRIEANPLIVVPSTTGSPALAYAAENVTASDMKKVDQRPNGKVDTVKLLPKLDYQLNQNVSITLGSSLYGVRNDVYDRLNSIFTPDGGRQTTGFSGVGYLRFTQKFGQGGAAKENTVSNAFYTVQVDYKKDLYTTQDKNLKQNTFDYGYLGKFHETYAPVYFSGIDTASGKAGVQLFGYAPVSVEFTPSDKNPILAHYTEDYLNFHGNSNTTNALANSDGYFLRNGGRPNDALSIWRNTGVNGTGWSKRNEDQVSFAVDASFDYATKLTKHTINFGLYYQQRNYRNYAISGSGLWGLMRQLERAVNDGRQVDNSNPTFVKNGITYTLEDVRAGRFNPSPQDTILYQLLFNQAKQGKFDRSLRAKLGKDVHDYINVDDLDPSTFSVDMFSADEILNSGSSLASYQGYDYTGKLQTGNVNFQDFWSKKENGEYTRPIAAYRPNYIAGYLSDFIQFKGNVNFNLGVRVERFDNNTKMLKDPYSLYGAVTVAENNDRLSAGQDHATNVLNGKTPSNIGSDYTVYVSGNTGSSPQIIGYRNGDDFYDPYGRAVEDPTFIQNMYASGGVLQPYLQNTNEKITDSSFISDHSFTDYKPQVNVMPRINFSFPMNDKALFYAHYDVLVQRPETQVEAYSTPYDYYFLSQNAGQIIGNTALKPQKTIDYEVGFQQQLTPQSGITITAFYKERKDQIQVRPYLYAYPTTYYTYGNRDFSSTKGFSLSYDLRRIGNISMGINYTLQFAEGTGSDTKSANGGDATFVSSSGLLQNFISASLPNLRSPFALGYDSRHNINANIDYRYLDNQGPVVGGKHIFQNMGANLTFFTRSGEPYTRYQQTQLLLTGVHNNSVIAGDVNGSRLPWHYQLNLRVDKEFAVKFNNNNTATTVADRRKSGGLSMTAYVSVTNLLNTRDVVSVYGYTGRAGDDGYLTSPQGSLAAQSPSLINSQAYIDQYSIRANDPSQLNAPRRINLGLQVNF